MGTLQDRATQALRTAMRERDRDAMSALRTLLAAFANAEAVAVGVRAGAIEGAPVGVGAAEADRRDLDEDERRAILTSEIAECEHGVATAAAHGQTEAAERLRRQADVLRGLAR
jgi:uncharacterized protein YqeY